MQIEKYLKTYQPIIYKTFLNSLKEKKLSHAYLISGNPGTPLKEVAIYLAKSILCDDPSPLACNNCITCLRIDDDNYPDFIVYDGAKEEIKKGAVEEIETRFEKKAFESKGIMIYIIHLVENMNVQATNSILKFLEEPESNIYAFLTTNNESIILPTIISRCQTLHLKQIDRKQVINEAIELGVEREDAELLSYFYNSSELIVDVLVTKTTLKKSSNPDEKERISEYNKEAEAHNENKETYEEAKQILVDLIEVLKNNDDRELIYYYQTRIVPKVNDKETARFFLDMLAQLYEDILNVQNGRDIILTSYQDSLFDLANKMNHVDKDILSILKARNMINLRVNLSSLLDHLFLSLVKEPLC